MPETTRAVASRAGSSSAKAGRQIRRVYLFHHPSAGVGSHLRSDRQGRVEDRYPNTRRRARLPSCAILRYRSRSGPRPRPSSRSWRPATRTTSPAVRSVDEGDRQRAVACAQTGTIVEVASSEPVPLSDPSVTRSNCRNQPAEVARSPLLGEHTEGSCVLGYTPTRKSPRSRCRAPSLRRRSPQKAGPRMLSSPRKRGPSTANRRWLLDAAFAGVATRIWERFLQCGLFSGQQAFGKAVLEALLKRGEDVVAVYVAPEKPGAKADPCVVPPSSRFISRMLTRSRKCGRNSAPVKPTFRSWRS